MKRYCNVFYCDRRRDFLCCTTCQSRGRCRNRCLNDPCRCGLEDVTRRRKKKEAEREGEEEQLPGRPL